MSQRGKPITYLLSAPTAKEVPVRESLTLQSIWGCAVPLAASGALMIYGFFLGMRWMRRQRKPWRLLCAIAFSIAAFALALWARPIFETWSGVQLSRHTQALTTAAIIALAVRGYLALI